MNLPEWATKPLDQMTEEDQAAWDAWDPTAQEALAASHAVCERAVDNLSADGFTLSIVEIPIEDL